MPQPAHAPSSHPRPELQAGAVRPPPEADWCSWPASGAWGPAAGALADASLDMTADTFRALECPCTVHAGPRPQAATPDASCCGNTRALWCRGSSGVRQMAHLCLWCVGCVLPPPRQGLAYRHHHSAPLLACTAPTAASTGMPGAQAALQAQPDTADMQTAGR